MDELPLCIEHASGEVGGRHHSGASLQLQLHHGARRQGRKGVPLPHLMAEVNAETGLLNKNWFEKTHMMKKGGLNWTGPYLLIRPAQDTVPTEQQPGQVALDKRFQKDQDFSCFLDLPSNNDQLRLPHFVLQPMVQAHAKVDSQVQGHDCWTAGGGTIVTAGPLDY